MTDAATFRELKLDDVRKLMDEGSYDIVDVREDWEWNKGHLPGARHVVLNSILANPTAQKFRDRTIFASAAPAPKAEASRRAIRIGSRRFTRDLLPARRETQPLN